MKDFDLEIYVNESAWLKVSKFKGKRNIRHRGKIKDLKEISEILINLGNELNQELEKSDII